MSQPLSWWKNYYATIIWQGVVTDIDEIKGMLSHLIAVAQEPYNVEQSKVAK